jgi:serine/threonine protein kinase
MEYCDKGNLPDYLKTFKPSFDDRVKLATDILLGLRFCHSIKLMHRDLKPSNIFIGGSDNKAKIGDFGLAAKMKQNELSNKAKQSLKKRGS